MLNKNNFKVAEFAAAESQRYEINAIEIGPDHTIATTGQYLVWVSGDNAKTEEFPVVEGTPKSKETFAPFLLYANAAKEIGKAIPKEKSLTIFNHAALGFEERNASKNAPVITVTDGVNPRSFRPAPVSGEFPKLDGAFPVKKPVVRFVVNADYLQKIAKFAADFNEEKSVLVTVYGPHDPIRFDAHDAKADQSMTALLMPVDAGDQKEDVRRSYGWVEREAQRKADEKTQEKLDKEERRKK